MGASPPNPRLRLPYARAQSSARRSARRPRGLRPPGVPPMTQTALRTEEITLNMGPQHPSTHGVIRFILKTDGEIVHECQPDVGYLHRAIEKISEKVEWQGFIPYTDRVDYLAAMNCNWAYSLAVEKLAG